MEGAIKISYNPSQEMMHIENDKGTLFYGNYWDFSRNPKDLAKLFEQMGLKVKIDQDLPDE